MSKDRAQRRACSIRASSSAIGTHCMHRALAASFPLLARASCTASVEIYFEDDPSNYK